MKKENKGISLIALIVIIAIIIILAGIIYFGIFKTNINKKAQEAVFKSDVANLRDELQTYHYAKTLDNEGKYNQKLLYADKTMVEYDENIDSSITMIDLIKTIKQKKEYADKFEVFKGELVYIGNSREERDWAKEIGIDSRYAEPKIEISGPSIEEIKAGTKVEYEITVSSNFKLEYVNFEGNIDLVKKVGEETTTIKTIENEKIEVIEESEKLKKVKVEVDTTGLENGEYAIVVKEKIAKDEMEMENTVKKESDTFSVNTIVYEDIKITPSTSDWTNQNVTVTITYPEGMKVKQYKIGIETKEFKNYTGPFEVEENTLVIATGTDDLGNSTKSPATLTISKIDKVLPELIVPADSAILISEVSTFNILEGVSASDNTKLDVDIKSEGKLENKSGIYEIKYIATDVAGNITTKTRKITVRDTVPPIITLLGSDSYEIAIGETFKDPGATAYDQVDGDVSDSIVISNNIDNTKKGEYQVVYTATDNDGNKSTKTRKVVVYETVYRSRTINDASYESDYTATANYTYSCPSGYTSSGSGSSMTCSKTETVTTSPNSSGSYSCPSGYSLSGSTCYKTETVTTSPNSSVSYSCSSGYTLSGTTCSKTTSTSANVSYSCPSGYTLSGTTCSKTTSTSASVSYSCPSGYSSSGSGSSMTCKKTSSTSPNSSTSYSCPWGGSRSGSTCYGATYSATTSCPSGYSESTNSCVKAVYASKTGGSCPSGYQEYSGTQCVKSVYTSKSYSCSKGGSLSGTTCSYNYPATTSTTYSCPSGYTSSGSGSSMTCKKTSTTSANKSYSCSSGTLSGSNCITTSTTSASKSYSCSTGTLSGTSCKQTTTTSATANYTYSCPSGYSSSGSGSSMSCYRTSTSSTSASYNVTYYCPSGYSSSGSGSSMSCYKSQSTSTSPNKYTSYSCPSGGTLSGTTCKRGYYSCSSGTLSGSKCYGSWGSWTTTVIVPSSNLEVETDKKY